MPHLSFEYSEGLDALADLPGFAAACRDALVNTGVCPLGGIRVRGFRANVQAIADDAAPYYFIDMTLRLGVGRDDATRSRIADELYAAAEVNLRPQLAEIPFVLSLEIQEVDPLTSRKSWSTIHRAIADAARA